MGPGRIVSMRTTRLRESCGREMPYFGKWGAQLDGTTQVVGLELLLLISEPARFLAVRDPPVTMESQVCALPDWV